jgi:hypothetical protein
VERAGANTTVLDVEFPSIQITKEALIQRLEQLRRKRGIHLAPSNMGFTGRFLNNEFVIGRSTRMRTRTNNESSTSGYAPFPTPNDLFIERCRGQVSVNSIQDDDSLTSWVG